MIIRVKVDGQIYDVEVEDLSARPIIARVGEETFEITPEEAGAAAHTPIVSAPDAPVPVAQTSGNGAGSGDSVRTVNAPIPGVIISISVQPGDKVSHGQELCMLEAMKMKNSIRATRTATVEKVHIAVGAQVRQGQPLVTYTE